MDKNPIDLNSPLGISKKEWTKVLGINLALLLVVYSIALACTLCGSDFFMLRFFSDDLQRIEATLRGWGIFPLLQIAFETLEVTLVLGYAIKWKVKWYFPIILFACFVIPNVLFTQLMGSYPSYFSFLVLVAYLITVTCIVYRKDRKTMLKGLARVLIGLVVSFVISELISVFRTYYFGFWKTDYTASVGFALNVEHNLALVLSLLLLTLAINWEPRKGGTEECPINPGASGSSPLSTMKSPKPMWNAKRNPNKLPPRLRKRIRLIKAKYIAIQTSALVIISLLPIVSGKGVEYALAFASFSITRMCLGFSRSLHFKSELTCVTVGALTFWGLAFLAPSIEASLIFSLIYGAGLAIGFRLYWELHDLILYRRAAKLDRYAMFYCAFKGDTSPRRITGVMLSKGYSKEDVTMVALYMERVKVEAIGIDMNYSKRAVEDRLTRIANELYAGR